MEAVYLNQETQEESHLTRSLVINIPFCRALCEYCNFSKLRVNGSDLIKDYLVALEEEISFVATTEPLTLKSISLVGGTPTILTIEQISSFLPNVTKTCKVKEGEQDLEVIIEANPEDLTLEYCKKLSELGVTQLNVGVQSFIALELEALGRKHTVDMARTAIENALSAGIPKIATDIALGLPRQEVRSLVYSLRTAMLLGVTQINLISLEEITPCLELNRLQELARAGINELRALGYERYGNVTFIRCGDPCRADLLYSAAENYRGVGYAAHSFYMKDNFLIEERNSSRLQDYLKYKGQFTTSTIYNVRDGASLIIERGLLGCSGLNIQRFEKLLEINFKKNYQEELHQLFMKEEIEIDGNFIKLTDDGAVNHQEVIALFKDAPLKVADREAFREQRATA
jgi:oxygen-independent coproporphyrinogen-3 oxidase